MEITWTNGEWWRLEPETGIKNSLQRQTSSPSNKSTTRRNAMKQNHKKSMINLRTKRKNKKRVREREWLLTMQERFWCAPWKWRLGETETYKTEIDLNFDAYSSPFMFIPSKSIDRLGVAWTRPIQYVIFALQFWFLIKQIIISCNFNKTSIIRSHPTIKRYNINKFQHWNKFRSLCHYWVSR